MNRFWGCFLCAMLAWFVGKALGVPVWRNWDIGDRADMAVTAFMAALALSRRRR